MRRILRKIAENDLGSLGDTSTLADPSVVDNLIANRPVLASLSRAAKPGPALLCAGPAQTA
jgi:hypothetical protein